jgi:hypothetical protein
MGFLSRGLATLSRWQHPLDFELEFSSFIMKQRFLFTSKPLVSDAMMTSRIEGRQLIKMSRISNHARKNLQDVDWVTIGCIVGKSRTRTSAKVAKSVGFTD